MNEEFEKSLIERKRQLSRFFANELVLDYIEDRLDPVRVEAMHEHMSRNKEAKAEIENAKSALDYLKRLSAIDISPNLVNQIETTKVGWQKWADRFAWRNWPEIARWSLEAVAIAAVLAGAVSMLPMQRLARFLPRPAQDLVLVEVRPQLEVPNEDEANHAATPEATDEVQATAPSAPVKIASAEKKPEAGNILKTDPPPPPKPKPAQKPAEPVQEAKTENSTESIDEEVKSSGPSAESVAEDEPAAPKTTKGPKGFVYRAFMSAATIDETTTSVRDLVVSLGGQKAGQVDLGWRKSSGTYFHFALPESNYEALLEGLRSFGPVRIYKDPHWRLMPEGQIRLILFIEDVNIKK